ncbi:hypothetical protein [Bradyrhizobium ivorense]|nr:hypothetical protein [Bradyrhizobium ivorense]
MRDPIQKKVQEIRSRIDAEKAKGKVVGYLSIPISTIAGSYFGENVKVAAEIKERVESGFGPKAAWLLDSAGPEVSLPSGANGAEYMLMWTNVLAGPDGLGAFDFVYFTGPSDFAYHFGLDGHDDLTKLDQYYDSASKTDPGLKAVSKKEFRAYYGIGASVTYSYGSHDEWDIVRSIKEARRKLDEKTTADKQKVGIAIQMGVYFDGQAVAPGLFETGIAAGNAGKCAAPDDTKTR